MRSTRIRLFLFAALLVAACKASPSPARADAAPAPSAASLDAGRPAVLDDLLHFTDARIGVSSKVDNPRDFAEHVADGRLDTAWNGKTGDLVGGWIGFRVPAAVRVKLIELTVGYVAKSAKGEDLFAMNHRIARVRVTRDGAALGGYPLDPDSRALQRIAVDAAGGDFKIEVLAVKPGTKTTWRELVISELRVFGDAGAARHPSPTIPHVSVGGFDAPPPATAATPFVRRRDGKDASVSMEAATPEAYCRAWLAPIMTEYASLYDGGVVQDVPWPPPEPSCAVQVEQTRGDVKLLTIHRSNLRERWSEPALQRGGRTILVGGTYHERSHFDPGCTGASGGKLQSARFEGDSAVFVLYHFGVVNPWPQFLPDGSRGEGTPGSSERSLVEIRCVLGDAGAPLCTATTLAGAHGPYDESVFDGPAPLPWK